jgi:hypothetical protein
MADPHPSVLVTNLTDALGKRPTLLGIYTCDLAPGESVLLPAHLIDEKFRPLELAGLIHLGSPLPASYLASKRKQKTRAEILAANAATLTEEPLGDTSSEVVASESLEIIARPPRRRRK